MKQFYLFCCILIIVSCKKDESPNNPPKIIQFAFEGVKSITTNIDPKTKVVTIEVPYQTSINALVPIIGIEDDVSIIPASGIAQNFSQAVYYTLSKRGDRLIYTVKVIVANQPKPEISQVKSDTVEAGNEFVLVGKNYGKFALDIQAFLIDNDNKETLVKHQLIDSTQIRLTTSIDQKTDLYRIKVKIKNQEVISTAKIWISYPSPQLISLERTNILKGDTLWVKGKYIDATKYSFLCQLSNKNVTYKLSLTKSLPNQLGFILPNHVTVGEYEVKIYNISEKKLSREIVTPISIYDSSFPFVTSVFNLKSFYKPTDKLTFNTINFDKIEARFYQVSLESTTQTYIQNGIYDATKRTLSIDLPDAIQTGTYAIFFSLSEPKQNIYYSFKTDLQIAVKE